MDNTVLEILEEMLKDIPRERPPLPNNRKQADYPQLYMLGHMINNSWSADTFGQYSVDWERSIRVTKYMIDKLYDFYEREVGTQYTQTPAAAEVNYLAYVKDDCDGGIKLDALTDTICLEVRHLNVSGIDFDSDEVLQALAGEMAHAIIVDGIRTMRKTATTYDRTSCVSMIELYRHLTTIGNTMASENRRGASNVIVINPGTFSLIQSSPEVNFTVDNSKQGFPATQHYVGTWGHTQFGVVVDYTIHDGEILMLRAGGGMAITSYDSGVYCSIYQLAHINGDRITSVLAFHEPDRLSFRENAETGSVFQSVVKFNHEAIQESMFNPEAVNS